MGDFALRKLGLKRPTWIKYLVGVSVGFAVSGAIHMAGDLVTGFQYIGKSSPFFALQIPGIALEQLVIRVASSLGVRGSFRWLGFLWVMIWFSVSAVGFLDWGIHVGFFYKDALPFSPTRYLLDKLSSFGS